MSLKAVLLDFNGVIIKDETIHQELVAEIMLGENLRSDAREYKQYCRGRSDRACLRDILASRGRILSEDYLSKLIEAKTKAYQQQIEQLAELPLSPKLPQFLAQLKEQGLIIGLVTGALRSQVKLILERAKIAEYFTVIVAGDDLIFSKPEPDGYLSAIAKINQQHSGLNLQPSQCLAIEDNPVGIEAAKRAKIQVVGIANIYPLHMLQRQANWTVDNFMEIELERVDRVLSQAKKC
jgi:beta-phosphoglucomutase